MARVAPPQLQEQDGWATVDPAVASRRVQATYVARRSPHEWFVGGPEFVDRDETEFRRITVAELLRAAPVLEFLFDLPVGFHAFRESDSESWTRGEIPQGNMYLVSYEVRPTEAYEGDPDVGGAFANCWVVAESVSIAKDLTSEHLEETGWGILSLIEAQEKAADDLVEGTEGYYRQARIDGLVCVLHTFPADDLEYS